MNNRRGIGTRRTGEGNWVAEDRPSAFLARRLKGIRLRQSGATSPTAAITLIGQNRGLGDTG